MGWIHQAVGLKMEGGKRKKQHVWTPYFVFLSLLFLYSSSTLVSLASVYIHVTSQLKHLSLYGTSGGHKPLCGAATAALYL